MRLDPKNKEDRELLRKLGTSVKASDRALIDETLAEDPGKRLKYGNKKHTYDGHKFDSLKEVDRYVILARRLKRGVITDLKLHERFNLIVNDILICGYVADFVYTIGDRLVVEDVKVGATKTRLYILKKKLMKACLGIDIVEVHGAHD